MRTAIVVYDGVSNDECEAFGAILGLLTGGEVVMVGATASLFHGPGGGQVAEVDFDAASDVDIVVVPGGIGCERAAHDAALQRFLQRMERDARYIAASSTGSVVLAAAGVLHGRSAATHWLASDLLARYGSPADDRRLVIDGRIITCEGRISAVEAAFALVELVAGRTEAERIRAALLEGGQHHLRRAPWWRAARARFVEARRTGKAPPPPRRHDRTTRPTPATVADAGAADAPTSPDQPIPETPISVMIELVEDEDLVRRLRRQQRRRRQRLR